MRKTKGESPYEARYGFSRAVRVGDRIIVAGTGPVAEGGGTEPGDAAAQARRCFAIARAALEDLGGSLTGTIRTRMYITDPADADAIGAVHAEIFAEIRPAATMIVINSLLDPEWRVEIELEAFVAP
ncbi:RidA family protein [Sphingomicrobium sp. XHP0239]|uniref:RidA family protein n=1 Tax=Sphingomicrobium maritimum TaxID=3133972 RepID=UPI0031CC8C79